MSKETEAMSQSFKNAITLLLLCLASLGSYGQNSYLMSVGAKASPRSAPVYFYLQELPTGSDLAQPSVLTVGDAVYRIDYFRLREPSASSYFGCTKYADEAAGEMLSLNDLLTEQELNTYAQTQQSIEAQCTALFDNRGRPNSLVTIDLNDQDIKILKVRFDVCTCKVSHNKFSTLSDTLAMPRKVIQTDVFNNDEKLYWQNRIHHVLNTALVQSCLPATNSPYSLLGPVGQR